MHVYCYLTVTALLLIESVLTPIVTDFYVLAVSNTLCGALYSIPNAIVR
jgi:hypothetical protein